MCEQEHYVDMMLHSLPLWHELQDRTGTPLLATTGGLTIAPTNSDQTHRLAALYQKRGFDHELLSGAELAKRYPQFQLEPGLEALYQPDFGVLFADKCVTAAWAHAKELGVTTVTDFCVTQLRADGDAVHVDGHARSDETRTRPDETGTRSDETQMRPDELRPFRAPCRARAVVLAPGSWLSPLTKSVLGVSLPTRVSAETVCYYAPRSTNSTDLTNLTNVMEPTRAGGAAGEGHPHCENDQARRHACTCACMRAFAHTNRRTRLRTRTRAPKHVRARIFKPQ
eukprot:6184423-Pleurochrysis_carterae.AAC.1